MKNLFVIVGILGIMAGCGTDTGLKEKKRDFPDLTGFLNDQEKELRKEKVSFEKTISMNGRREMKVAEHFDWRKELKPLYDCDLNRSAMINEYRMDSLKKGDTTFITCTAPDKRAKVKKMDIVLYEHTIHCVLIHTSVSNPWFTQEQELSYQKNKGYSIDETRKMALSGRDRLKISVLFLH